MFIGRVKNMRVAKKEIKDRGVVEEVLAKCPVGRLGTTGEDGWPMVKPLNFIYQDGKIYFHCAREGEKIDDINRDSRVCFEVDLPLRYVKGTQEDPCKADYLYQSVICKGRARLVSDEGERKAALGALMKKYQPEGGYGGFLEQKLALTAVVRIIVETMTGKQDLG